MTVKFTRSAGNRYISTPDNPALTYPAAPWSLGFIVTFDGTSTSADAQYIISNGIFQAAGSFNVSYFPANSATTALRRRLALYVGTNSAVKLSSLNDNMDGASYLFVFQFDGTNLTLRRCPILSTEPTDGSAVLADGSTTLSGALDGPAGMYLGARADVAATRMGDQSMGRVFRHDGLLTNFEIAQLAWGKEITDLGKTPAWYVRLDTVSDIADRGPAALPFTVNGAVTTSSTQPAFGYAPAATMPVIDGTPTINGTPQEGVAIGFTRAPVTGTSTPSQQWLLDGVNISGATGATYTPAVGSATKGLSVRQIETNGASVATATSAPVTIAAAPAAGDTVTATAMPAERVFQRNGTSAAINMTGGYTGTMPTSLEYRLFAENGTTESLPWTTMTGATIGAGTWAATPAVPQGGPYRRQVRTMNGSTPLATGPIETEVFLVGGLHAWIGSSSAELRFISTSGTGFTALPTVRRHSLEVGFSRFTTNGVAILEANAYAQQSGAPVGMLDCGKGSTTLNGWLNTNNQFWKDFVSSVAAVGGKLESVSITVGSNDASAGTVVSRAAHAANLRTLIARVREVCGNPDLHIGLSGMNRRFAGSTTGVAVSDQQANFVHMAELDVGGDYNVTLVQTMDLTVLTTDGTHLTATSTGFAASAARNGYVFGRRWFGDGVYVRGPRVTDITATGLEGVATIQHSGGTDFTPATGITGFTAKNSANEPVTVTAARTSATKIALTFSEAPAWVGYLATANPSITGQVFDNGPTALPMRVESDLVLTSLEPPADTTGPTFTGALAVSNITTNSATVTAPAATDAVGVAGYQISTNGSAYSNAAGSVVTLTGLSPGTLINVQMRAYDAALNYSAPLSTSFNTLAVTPPPDPDPDPDTIPSFTASKIRTVKALAGGGLEGNAFFKAARQGMVGRIDPDSVIDITVDWSGVLADTGDSIATASVQVTNATTGTAFKDGATTTAFISAPAGAEVQVRFRIVTASVPARVEDRTIYLTVGDQ